MFKAKQIISAALLSLLAQTSHAIPISYQDIFTQLSETESIKDVIPLGIDSTALTVNEDSDVNVFFISEGAGYRNTFGWYEENGDDPRLAENRSIIWRNASLQGSGGRLSQGDSYSLGLIESGTTLGFFLTANGYYTGPDGTTFFTNDEYNPDDLVHVVSSVLPDLGLVALGFEDIYGGGDNDYNDLVIVIDIGTQNAKKLAANEIPIPESITLLALGFLAMTFNRRKAKKLKPKHEK